MYLEPPKWITLHPSGALAWNVHDIFTKAHTTPRLIYMALPYCRLRPNWCLHSAQIPQLVSRFLTSVGCFNSCYPGWSDTEHHSQRRVYRSPLFLRLMPPAKLSEFASHTEYNLLQILSERRKLVWQSSSLLWENTDEKAQGLPFITVPCLSAKLLRVLLSIFQTYTARG